MFDSITTGIRCMVLLCLVLLSPKTYSAEPDVARELVTQSHFIDVGGVRLHLNVQAPRTASKSRGVIILEAGGGYDSTQWRELQPQLAIATGLTVVSYDRAGFGQSDLPETSYDIAEEIAGLHTALHELELNQRLILVGHSFGGLLIQLYAHRWPDNVAALVFIDPSSPSALLGLGGATMLSAPKLNPVSKREQAFARINASGIEPYLQVYRAPLPASLLIVVLSAETGLFPSPRQNRVFRLSHELLSASVDDGELVVAAGSGHNIPAQRPDLIVAAVQRLLTKMAR